VFFNGEQVGRRFHQSLPKISDEAREFSSYLHERDSALGEKAFQFSGLIASANIAASYRGERADSKLKCKLHYRSTMAGKRLAYSDTRNTLIARLSTDHNPPVMAGKNK